MHQITGCSWTPLDIAHINCETKFWKAKQIVKFACCPYGWSCIRVVIRWFFIESVLDFILKCLQHIPELFDSCSIPSPLVRENFVAMSHDDLYLTFCNLDYYIFIFIFIWYDVMRKLSPSKSDPASERKDSTKTRFFLIIFSFKKKTCF